MLDQVKFSFQSVNERPVDEANVKALEKSMNSEGIGKQPWKNPWRVVVPDETWVDVSTLSTGQQALYRDIPFIRFNLDVMQGQPLTALSGLHRHALYMRIAEQKRTMLDEQRSALQEAEAALQQALGSTKNSTKRSREIEKQRLDIEKRKAAMSTLEKELSWALEVQIIVYDSRASLSAPSSFPAAHPQLTPRFAWNLQEGFPRAARSSFLATASFLKRPRPPRRRCSCAGGGFSTPSTRDAIRKAPRCRRTIYCYPSRKTSGSRISFRSTLPQTISRRENTRFCSTGNATSCS